MERLTENFLGCYQIKGCGNFTCEETCNNVLNCDCCPISEAINKLAEYEDLEEQGLLFRFPCKVGDTVYRINNGARKPIIPLYVVELRFKQVGSYIREKICCSDDSMTKTASSIYYKEDIGNRIFLSKAEAEQKLKEMESD